MLSSRRIKTALQSVVFTSAITFVMGCFKVYLDRKFNLGAPFLLFYTSVALSAWRGGFYQGFLSVGISLAFILTQFNMSTLSDDIWYWRFGVYLIDCLIVTTICSELRRSKARTARSYSAKLSAEMEKRQSEVRLHKIFESNMIGLIFSNPDGKITQANDYYLNLIGAKRADLEAGKLNWKDFTTPERMKLSTQAVERVMKDGFIPPFEKEYTSADGTIVPVVVGAARVDEQTVVAYVMEISDRKKAERTLAESRDQLEERVQRRTQELTDANAELSQLIKTAETTAEQLRESRSFLDSVIENIPNMIFVKEASDLRFVRFNKAGQNLLGLSQDQLVGKNDFDLFPKEQAAFFTEKDRAVIKNGVVVDIPEEPLLTPAGLRSLHTKKIPIFDKSGKALYLLGISEDITERKQADQQRLDLIQAQAARMEAEKSAQRLSFLSEASAALNESLDINDMLESFSRVVVHHIADACLVDFYDSKIQRFDRIAASSRHTVLRSTTPDWRGRLKLNESGGGIVEVAASGKPVVHSHVPENLASLLGISSESLRRLLPEGSGSLLILPLSQHGETIGTLTLISRDSGRYDEIDLSIALDLAKRASFAIDNALLYSRANEASRAKSAFLANISHELRTPLGAMLGFAELALEEGDLSDNQAQHLTTIARNGHQLLRIVDEVLDLSKVESDRLEIERLSFNLPKLLSDVTMLLSLKAEEKGLRLGLNIQGELPTYIKTDPLRLRQIILNMIGNAIKFTQKGGVDVQVRYRPGRDAAHGLLDILVVDTGIGIFPEQAQKLFHPFVQADGSMTRKFGGTGLGLFLSRKLARLLGGDVVLAHSNPDEGSAFRVTLEVEETEKSTASVERPLDLSLRATSAHDNRVLVVDDAKENRMLVYAYLSRMGLQSELAENGKEGVSKALAGDYAVILMDLQMPEMDGFEALQMLRASGFNRPIIALTAHAMKGDRERCLQSGFDDYLSKPLSRQALSDCLAQYIPLENSSN